MKTYSIWHRHAHVKGGAGAWYQRHQGLEREDAYRRPRPLLGLTLILPDGELPSEGTVALNTSAFEIQTSKACPKGMVAMISGSQFVFGHAQGVIECPGKSCDGATFDASLRDDEAVLSCTKCGHELRG